MAIHIDASAGLVQNPPGGLMRRCPHCTTVSHLMVVAAPSYAVLDATRPLKVGIVCQCDACRSPVFLRLPVTLYGRQRIDLSPAFEEVEPATEPLETEFLPAAIERLCREALGVFAASCWIAFALMCRRIVHEMSNDLGEHGRLKLFDQLNDWRELAEIDAETFGLLRRVLAGTDAAGSAPLPDLDADSAGILLEALLDLLYQSYTRRGRVRAALLARRRPTDPPPSINVTPLNRQTS